MERRSRTDDDYELCTELTDRSWWHPKVVSLHDYWLSIGQPGRLPGRQHFDPLAIHRLLPNIWLLDVVGSPPRFRFRVFGSHLVTMFGGDPTGQFFDVFHRDSGNLVSAERRLTRIATERVVIHGRDRTQLFAGKEHMFVEVLQMPLARDGHTVDMILVFSLLTNIAGKEL